MTAEVTPHHLLLTEEAVRTFDANTKMNPPLRSKRDTEALLEALVDGTIDCIATDHAPHAVSEKEGEFDRAAFGIVGLETAVALLLDRLVRPGAPAPGHAGLAAEPRPRPAARAAGRQPGAGRAGGPHAARPGRGRGRSTRRGSSRGAATRPSAAGRLTGRPWKTIVGGARRMGVREALLVLRDGRVFRGEALGAEGETSR